MNVHAHPLQKAGILRITGGVRSEEEALALKAALEDLPGVYTAEMTRDAVRLRFDPELASEQQLYEAVKIAGYHASDFSVLPES
jgi:copper chaperone CopZ